VGAIGIELSPVKPGFPGSVTALTNEGTAAGVVPMSGNPASCASWLAAGVAAGCAGGSGYPSQPLMVE
jgi:hypothetical protein